MAYLAAFALLGGCRTAPTASVEAAGPAVAGPQQPEAFGVSRTSSYPDARDYLDPGDGSWAEEKRTGTERAPQSHPSPAQDPLRPEKLPASHTVARGDTLFSIGGRYGISVATLKAANGLTSDTIFPGDVLAIPR